MSPLKARLDLVGELHEEIRETMIRLKNGHPSDCNGQPNRESACMEGFARLRRGEVGDITAGLSLGPWAEELSWSLMTKS